MPFTSKSQVGTCLSKEHKDLAAGKTPAWNCADFLTETKVPFDCLPQRKTAAKKDSTAKKCAAKPSTISNKEIAARYNRKNRRYYRGRRSGIYFYFGNSKQFVPPEAKAYVEKNFEILEHDPKATPIKQREKKTAAAAETTTSNKKRARSVSRDAKSGNKPQAKKAKTVKAEPASSTTDGAASEWRGRMQVSMKSKKSVAALQAKKGAKSASKVVAESLSTTIGANDDLLLLSDSLLRSHILTAAESSLLQERANKFVAQHKEPASVFKLQWRDRAGATLVGVRASKKGATFDVQSARIEPYQCSLSDGDDLLWLASKSSLEKLALGDIKGNRDSLLCVLPKYKGIVRVTTDGMVGGAQALKIKAK